VAELDIQEGDLDDKNLDEYLTAEVLVENSSQGSLTGF